ncbi:MAG: AAA family ATPase [Novipirellula sp. JB048]
MRILDIYINGYRSLANVRWQPERLNVLIGPNGSGKSNVLRALQTISTAANGGLSKLVQRDGGMERLVWDGQKEDISFRMKMSPYDENRDEIRDSLTYELELARLGQSSSYRIEQELLGNFHKMESGESNQPFKLLERTPHNAVVFDPQEHGLRANEEDLDEAETLLSVAGGPLSVNYFVRDFRKGISDWTIYEDVHTNRDAEIRQAAVTRNETTVEPSGQNLLSVLHTLYSTDREFKYELNLAMKAAFGDEFEELVFPPAADQRVQMRVRWRSLRREQSAADLSDGTLRFLFLIAVLANPNPPTLIAIDEPESGLHPSMLSIVAEYARDASLRSQVILTTHSPEFLDAFGSEPPNTVVVNWRDGMTSLNPISGEKLQYWLKQYTLGELFSSKELESMQ